MSFGTQPEAEAAGFTPTAVMAQSTLSLAQLIVGLAPGSVLPAPRAKKNGVRFHRCVCPDPTVGALYEAMISESMAISSLATVGATLGVALVPVALAHVPVGVVWCAPVHVTAPPIKSKAASLTVMATVLVPVAGDTSSEI